MKHFFLSLIALLTFASCDQPDTKQLLNREWHLEIFEDVAGLPQSTHQVPQDDHYVLVLNDTAATGVADCNTFQGHYKLDGERISITNIAVTEMDCGDNSLEVRFLQALRTAETFSLEDDALKIQYSNGKQLVFKNQRKQ